MRKTVEYRAAGQAPMTGMRKAASFSLIAVAVLSLALRLGRMLVGLWLARRLALLVLLPAVLRIIVLSVSLALLIATLEVVLAMQILRRSHGAAVTAVAVVGLSLVWSISRAGILIVAVRIMPPGGAANVVSIASEVVMSVALAVTLVLLLALLREPRTASRAANRSGENHRDG